MPFAVPGTRSRAVWTTFSFSPGYPLLTTAILRDLVATHRQEGGAATVLSFEPEDAKHYGRVLRDADGGLEGIVEHRDATAEQRAGARGQLVHLRVPGNRLWPVSDRLTPHNAQGELYLTDSVAILVGDGQRVAVHKEETRWRLKV